MLMRADVRRRPSEELAMIIRVPVQQSGAILGVMRAVALTDGGGVVTEPDRRTRRRSCSAATAPMPHIPTTTRRSSS
jgi:hypothetical protein